MKKAGQTTRDIQFYSNKNQNMVVVHSEAGRRYAEFLENQDNVLRYQCVVPLDKQLFQRLSHVEVRKSHWNVNWTSDFLLTFVDGLQAVREIVTAKGLTVDSTREQLELSRRYWSAGGITDWAIIIVGR